MATVLFVAAHPDDETLGMGVAIAEHVVAGHDVHCLVMSRSPGSIVLDYLNGTATSSWWGAPHDPAAEGYSTLTGEEFGQLRIDECARALECLASGLGAITLHEAGLAGGYTSAEAADAILACCDSVTTGPVKLKGHSQIVDDHVDHLAVGHALNALKAADAVRFGDVRHYILPRYWSDPRLSQVTESTDWPTNAGISARALNACRAYGSWCPPHSYAIGHHSVFADMFAPLMASPKCLYHP